MLDGIPILGLTAPTLLGLAVLMLMLGWIVPRKTLLDKQREADQWREAYYKERDARAVANKQVEDLLEAVRTNHAIVKAVFNVVQEKERRQRPGGGTNVLPKK